MKPDVSPVGRWASPTAKMKWFTNRGVREMSKTCALNLKPLVDLSRVPVCIYLCKHCGTEYKTQLDWSFSEFSL